MNTRLIAFGIAIAVVGQASLACDAGQPITKIVFLDSVVGVEKRSLEDTTVCFNFRQDDNLLVRKAVGAKDVNRNWPVAINLQNQESIRRMYWPDRPDVLAIFEGRKDTYVEGSNKSCALVGEVGLHKATRLFLDFENVNPALLKDIFIDAQGFEYFPAKYPASGCMNIDRRVPPGPEKKVGFKVAEEITGGNLSIEVPGESKPVKVTYAQLIKAANDWQEKKANRQANDDSNVGSTTSPARLAVASKLGVAQIKVADGYIAVSYETDK